MIPSDIVSYKIFFKLFLLYVQFNHIFYNLVELTVTPVAMFDDKIPGENDNDIQAEGPDGQVTITEQEDQKNPTETEEPENELLNMESKFVTELPGKT